MDVNKKKSSIGSVILDHTVFLLPRLIRFIKLKQAKSKEEKKGAFTYPLW